MLSSSSESSALYSIVSLSIIGVVIKLWRSASVVFFRSAGSTAEGIVLGTCGNPSDSVTLN